MAAPQPQQQLQQKELIATVNLLSVINKLMLKVFSVKKREGLIFLILNDTVQIVKYDRAVLWSLEDGNTKLLGVSGQSTVNAASGLAIQWKTLVNDIADPGKAQILTADSFLREKHLWAEAESTSPHPAVLWLPIVSLDKTRLGLWLERWEGRTWNPQEIDILSFVLQAYGVAWEKFVPKGILKWITNRKVLGSVLLLSLLLLTIRLPLRVVAPIEVIPSDPVIITAPLEEIVEKINVKPGQYVKTGDVLFEYDKDVASQTLKAAERQVEISRLELNRSRTLGIKDAKSLTEVAVLEAKLKREEVNLDLAKYHSSQLIVKSPIDGVVMLGDPHEWHGKPVHIGEKIMMVADPDRTKVRLFIPEDDNVILDLTKPVKIYLNISPEITREASLIYVANVSTISDKHLVSFVAEADWIGDSKDVKMGLKGSASLYGNDVSLFYLLVRKPWAHFRNFIGF